MTQPHPVRVGLKLSQDAPIASYRTVWQIADEGGFDHLWAFDHMASIGANGPGRDVFDGWSLLAAMAVATKQVRIGLMVTGVTYRHPAVLAKTATTVDHLSGGRLEFGLGSAWAENEHEMLDIPFYTVGGRIRRMGEAVQVVKKLWTEERAGFDGHYFKLREAIHEPKPVQKPHPPIWIGGSGEQLTLRVVAEHADVWNPSGGGGDPDEAARLSGILDERCAEVGRNPDQIRRSVQLRWDGAGPEAMLDLCGRFVQRGFSELVLYLDPAEAPKQAETATKLLPELKALR